MATPDPAPSSLRDPGRLTALAQSGVAPGRRAAEDGALDRLASLAGKILRAPVALVSLVDKDRQIFQGLVGDLPEPWCSQRETPLEYSFCQHVVMSGKPLVVHDAANDPRLAGNLAIRDLGVASYLGVPLTTLEGHVLGSLCVLDGVSRQWTNEDIETLNGLAAFANTELELRRTSHKMAEAAGHDRARTAEGADGTHLLVHDLRTPLNSLLLGLQTLPLLGPLNLEQREVLEVASRGGYALMSLVNDMLDLSAAEAGSQGLELHLTPIFPVEIMESSIRQVSSLARQRGIDLQLEIPSAATLSSRFPGDGDKLTRALVNLLGNAIKFTPSRGKITAVAHATEDAVEFSVRDTGRGIDPADHERIFHRFVRVGRNADGDGGRSSGLGLAFCKMVAEAHGGVIKVESELERGSNFCLRVPRRRD